MSLSVSSMLLSSYNSLCCLILSLYVSDSISFFVFMSLTLSHSLSLSLQALRVESPRIKCLDVCLTTINWSAAKHASLGFGILASNPSESSNLLCDLRQFISPLGLGSPKYKMRAIGPDEL